MKKCKTCQETKPFEEFYVRKEAKDGYRSECKICLNARVQKQQAPKRAEKNAKVRQKRKDNPEEVRKYYRDYRNANIEKVRSYHLGYYYDNKEHLKEKGKEWRRKHRKKCRAKLRARRLADPEEQKARALSNYYQNKENILERQRLRASREENKQKVRAHKAVKEAIEDGILIRPAFCSACGKQDKIVGHHHKGYEKKYQLTVEWLCCYCHGDRHKKKD